MRRVLALAAVLVASAALLGPPAPATAQADDGVRLVVTEFTGIVGPGASPPEAASEDATTGELITAEPEVPTDEVTIRLIVENRGEGALDGLRVVIESWGRVDTRSQMRAALDGGEVPAPRNSPVDLSVTTDGPLAAGEVRGVEITVSSERIGFDEDEATVHPLQLSVVRGTQVLDQVRTAVVHLPAPPTAPLETAVVWPIDDTPWRGPDGIYPAGIDAPILPGGRLDHVLRAVEQHPEVPVTLAPAAHLLEDLRDRADGFRQATLVTGGSQVTDVPPDGPAAMTANGFLRRIRDVVATTPNAPVTGPYADVVLAGLTATDPGLASLAGGAVTDGRQRLRALLDRRPDQGAFLATAPLDEAALDLIPADHLLVPYGLVAGPDLAVNPNVDIPYALRRTTTPSGRPMSVTVADPWVTDLLASADTDHGAVLAAHRVVVETALLQLRAPGVSGRPLLVLPPLDWSPPGRVAEEVLTGLAAAPWLRLTDASSLPARSERDPGVLRFAPADPTLPEDLASDLVAADDALEAATAALPDRGSIDGRPTAELEQQLLRAPSVWFLGGRVDRAGSLVRDVHATVDRSFGEVEVPASAQVTLTSERGTIPITLRREGGPLTVRVNVESPGGLAWPEGRTSPPVTLTEDGTQTVSFQTRALSRGTFAVTVTVTDPTGTRVLERTRLSVRSTAISGPALGITGVIVALLLLRGVLRRKPPDRPKLEVVR